MNKIIFLLFLVVIACQNKQEQPQQTATQAVVETSGTQLPKDSIKPPVVKQAGMPTVIKIPTGGSSSYTRKTKTGETVTVKLLPPPTRPAAAPNSPQGIPHFTNYNTEEGLALSSVRSSCIDKTGNLWFGTSGGGVSRYDGKSFTTFTTAQGLGNNSVWSIAEDKTGNLWFGTSGGGVSRYDGRHSSSGGVSKRVGSFLTFTTADGLPDDVVYNVKADKQGTVWTTTNLGVSGVGFLPPNFPEKNDNVKSEEGIQ